MSTFNGEVPPYRFPEPYYFIHTHAKTAIRAATPTMPAMLATYFPAALPVFDVAAAAAPMGEVVLEVEDEDEDELDGDEEEEDEDVGDEDEPDDDEPSVAVLLLLSGVREEVVIRDVDDATDDAEDTELASEMELPGPSDGETAELDPLGAAPPPFKQDVSLPAWMGICAE